MLHPRASSARPFLAVLLAVLAANTAPSVRADSPQNAWSFKDHDRIVLVGDTLIERDQRYGYLETLLTIANPGLDLTFRNLGWSADTVRGLSRAGFDPPEAGFKALKEQIFAARPTVLIFGYGMAESFDGHSGLPRFVEGYKALLDAVAPTHARLILLSPLPHERLAPPLPDPDAHNRDLALYADAVGKIAAERGATFIDLYNGVLSDRSRRAAQSLPDTDDGLHLTALGSWRLATSLAPFAGGRQDDGRGENSPYRIKNYTTSDAGVRFVSDDLRLPDPSEPGPPRPMAGNLRRLQVGDLTPGRYTLKVDDQPLLTRTAAEWAAGVVLPPGPELAQVEQLRNAVNEKNLLFFHRWRPQNVTYLFGFRKHEQGQNAVEIPQFDPLVDAMEKEIARLRKPVSHVYELVRENEASR